MRNIFSLFMLSLITLCVSAQQVNVTFRVDMSYMSSIDSTGVHVAGSFQGWNPATSRLDSLGNGIYQITLKANKGTHNFKFINGSEWNGHEEIVPEGCGTNDGMGNINRTITIGTTDTMLTAYYFGMCYHAESPKVAVDFIVDLSAKKKENPLMTIQKVGVVGDFNVWSTKKDTLTLVGNNIYAGTVTTFKNFGKTTFKYVINDTILETMPNRVDSIGANAISMDTTCYNQVGYPCQEPPAPSAITFRVNMPKELMDSQYQSKMFVYLNNERLVEMSDDNQDNIYEVTEIIADKTLRYMFVWSFLPDSIHVTRYGEIYEFMMDRSCLEQHGEYEFYRTLNRVDSSAMLLDVATFMSCSESMEAIRRQIDFVFDGASLNSTLPIQTIEAIIKIPSLYEQYGYPSFVDTIPLTPSSGLLYSGSAVMYDVLTNALYEKVEYSFMVNGINESAIPVRKKNFTGEITLTDTACFNNISYPCRQTSITFQVKLGDLYQPGDSVWVVGNFIQPSILKASTPILMTDDNLDGIYTVTVDGIGVNTVYYAFAYGQHIKQSNGYFTVEDHTIQMGCRSNYGSGYYRKYIQTTEDNVVLDMVCFKSCTETCNVGIEEYERIKLVDISPNPSQGIFYLTSLSSLDKTIQVYNAQGSCVFTGWNTSEINLSSFSKGIYVVHIQTEKGSSSQRIVLD